MATATSSRPRSTVKRPETRRRKEQPAGNEIRNLRRRHGLSQALLSRLLDVSLRTLSGAESTAAVPARMRRSVTQVTRLCDALADAMRPPYVGSWFDQPNDLLGGLKPVEAIERGQVDLVWQVAEGLRSGSPL